MQHFNIHGSDHGNLRSAWQDPSVDCQDKVCFCSVHDELIESTI